MAFVVRECPGNQYSVTGLDEFDQPIGTWSELLEFARSVLATDKAMAALSSADPGVVDVPLKPSGCHLIVPVPDSGDTVIHTDDCRCFYTGSYTAKGGRR